MENLHVGYITQLNDTPFTDFLMNKIQELSRKPGPPLNIKLPLSLALQQDSLAGVERNSAIEEGMLWQQEFPTQDGFYWFWGSVWAYGPDEDNPDLLPQPPTIAFVQDHRRFCYTAQGCWYDKSAFPGYCAGPLLPPPVPLPK